MKRAFAVLAMACLIVPAPRAAHALHEGCAAVGMVKVNTLNPQQCDFFATGPSYIVVATTNPYSVSVAPTRNGPWQEFYRRSVPGPPTAGELRSNTGQNTQAEKWYRISITCWDYVRNVPDCDQTGAWVGFIAAHSRI